MSYITFNPNETVYIRGIGYATLINCGSRSSISQKIQAIPVKKQSIYFDPDLFNSDIDSNNSKKSHSKSDEQKPQAKQLEKLESKKSEEGLKPKIQSVARVQEGDFTNIIQARVQGSNAMIYTSQRNLTKSIFICIKSLLINHKEQVIVQVEINKTVDTLRKAIFQQMGEQMANYYNIKLFATNPTLNELTVHTKIIHQCLIKDNDRLILTADYAFGFRTLPTNINCRFKITLTNNTLVSTVKPAAIPLPPPPSLVLPLPLPPPVQGEVKVESIPKIEQIKPISQIALPPINQVVEQKIIVIQNPSFHALCNVELSSGRRYWQYKIEKIPTDDSDLLVGVCSPPATKNSDSIQGCNYIWGYSVLSGKKNYISHDDQGNVIQDEQEQYGYILKQNDLIGILVSIKGKFASITFYKNSISCGEAYLVDLHALKHKGLVPFVNLGGEAQVTLDSKAALPLDSFRKK